MRAALVVLAMAWAVPAGADPDPFGELRGDAHWYYEVVEGPSIAALKAVRGAARSRCRVEQMPAVGSLQRAKLVCEASGATAPGRHAAVIAQTRLLVFDATGVRELRHPTDDPAQLADPTNGAAFTFPSQLPATGWSQTPVSVKTATATVRGRAQPVWLAEARDGTQRSAAALVPGGAPALLCAIAGTEQKPIYTCLRLADPTKDEQPRNPLTEGSADPPRPPEGRISFGGTQAQDKSSLKADAVASKIRSAYLAGLRRCYLNLLRKKPTAGGKLQLAFTVNAVGRAEEATATGVDTTLGECARGQIAAWRFPIPMSEYGEPRTARFVLALNLSAP